jgi:UPF0716 protein FxsA
MFFRLFLLFAIIPAVELALLIYAGSHIGVLNTIAIVLLTAIVGAYMVRQEGLGVVYRIQSNLASGVFPAEELIDGAMVLVAGALLLTPGFITDALGFLMVIPATRGILKDVLKRFLKKRVIHVHGGWPPGGPSQNP